MYKRLLLLLVLQVGICSFRSVACTFTANTNGNWTSIAWGKSGTGCGSNTTPGANDDVIINGQVRVTLNVNASIKSLVLNSGFNPANSTDLTVTGNITLTINGNITLNNHSNLIINNSAGVRGTGSICATNNGNVDVESNTGGGSFYVANCLSTASGCSNNANFINTGGLTYCIACGSTNQGQSTGGCVALPVQLVSFMGIYETALHRVKLMWQTSWEKDNDFFSVERSVDGVNFAETTRVSGHGTVTGISTYQAYDEDLTGIVAYYRLKQVDLDGHYEYSSVIAIALPDNAAAFEVYPNPLNGSELAIQFSSETAYANAKISICNVLGRELNFKKNAVEGSVVSLIITEKQPAGIYLLTVELPTKKLVRRITVL